MEPITRGALLILLLMCVPWSQASAYEVLRTSEGAELRWYAEVIPYYINPNGFDDFDQEHLIETAQRCFRTWTAEEFGLAFEYAGVIDVKTADDDNYNVIFFIQDPNTWEEMFRGQETALAMTRSWASRSGEILAFDLAFNDAAYDFTNTDDPDQIETDFANTLTHEVGHVLGLDHSRVTDACMYPTATRGEISKRYLSDDDREGIHYLYRPLAEAGCGYRGDDFSEAGGIACRHGQTGSGGTLGSPALLLLAASALFNQIRRVDSR